MYSNTPGAVDSNVRVAVRVRPLSRKEQEVSAADIIKVSGGTTLVIKNVKIGGETNIADSRDRLKTFSFDHVYTQAAESELQQDSQEQIFQDLGTDLLEKAFEGYNSCVFAYGMTGTGKSYTMMGSEDQRGLIPRIAEGLFSRLNDAVVEDKVRTQVEVSFLEIYNERVKDLLSRRTPHERYTLKIREDPKKGPYVPDLERPKVTQNDQIQELINQGNSRRVVAATSMHEASSRSHAIFTILFTQATMSSEFPKEISSKIHLVDLAGSERIDTDSASRSRMKEGANINKSLVTLAKVIQNLASQSLTAYNEHLALQSGADPEEIRRRRRHIHIPYRDSVLTWLIKDSLGGNSNTTMIATVTPADVYYNETINTLRYAQQAKNIVNRPQINEDPTAKLITELRQEILRLNQKLADSNRVLSMDNLHVQVSEKEKEIDLLNQQWTNKWNDSVSATWRQSYEPWLTVDDLAVSLQMTVA